MMMIGSNNTSDQTVVFSKPNVGWGCWSVNIYKYDKEQDRAANVSLNPDSLQTGFHTVEKYYTVDVLVVNGALFST